MARETYGEMLLKMELADVVTAILDARQLRPERAAELLGLTEQKVHDLLRGRLRSLTHSRLMECLVRLGRDVTIVVNETPRARSLAMMTVVVVPRSEGSAHSVQKEQVH